MKIKRVIITGGPSTGKTSILKQLEQSGFSCLHERSREIIQQSLKEKSNVLPWMDLLKFSEKVILLRKEQYHKVKSKISGEFTFSIEEFLTFLHIWITIK